MKKVISIIIWITIFISLFSCSGPKPPLSKDSLNEINKELKSWADGRWANYKASYDAKNSTLIIQVAAMPQSNETAWDGYCKVLKDLANKHANGYQFVGRIYVLGDVKKRCF